MAVLRLYLDAPLAESAELTLPPEASRHVQVLRLQPGDPLTVFNGQGGEWAAEITRMGRHDVDLRVGVHDPVQRELARRVTLAIGMPANERMDALIEKATELGAAAIQPLQCARSVLKLSGERADKRRAHWQGVAVAAAEQSGRTVVPQVEPIRTLDNWLGTLPATLADDSQRLLLSFAEDARTPRMLAETAAAITSLCLLSGPEGGLDEREEALARARGFVTQSLGARVLRADTAPLAALALLGL
ncbi:16S rRNA (uracil(1498)-N(3))-methyltransferase [Ideonella azotifigens]|uniref:Ribosomal RNA small subunit methyltransferase E n=2 Tax=Ideonella azotifigens TaxID=513160 RepID=A0ABN1JRP1_9BURK|nr:16S rRNA (uracil(1498)-N(3))-methyltransferase [Ideonella azotifigens]MCD2340232.1 16S rRNA (uracil(1498)-N(3))-methyltransferase [Ideonella azotifigens]